MAYTSRELDAPAAEVWAVIVDPHTYPRWLIGASEIRGVDPQWPAPGSAFHHRIGVGPFKLADKTTVKAIDEGRRLELAVRARPLVAATVRFGLVSDGRRTVLSFEEEPDPRLLGNLVRPVVDPLTHVRNHRSLRRLEQVVDERRSGRP